MENNDEIKNMGDDTGVVNVVEAEAEKQVRYEQILWYELKCSGPQYCFELFIYSIYQALSESGSDPDCADSLFGEDDVLGDEAYVVTTPNTPGIAPINFSHLLHPGQSRRPHSSMGLAASLGLDELALPPKSPLAGVRKQRQRTISTSGAINTEREPIIRASKRTIYTAGRPPWYDSQGQQVTGVEINSRPVVLSLHRLSPL